MLRVAPAIYDLFIPLSINWRFRARSAKQILRLSPAGSRRGAVVVNRDNQYRLVLAAEIILASDDAQVGDLHGFASICKLSNAEPNCQPLSAPYAYAWLHAHLSRNASHFLFIGKNSLGHLRLATIYENMSSRALQPHADCYCPICKEPYSIEHLPDNALCRRDKQPIRCL